MNATACATANELILAIDLGKYKSVACLYRNAADARFHAFPTTRAELERLLERHRPELLLIEACLPAGWLHDLCAERGVPCRVANTTRGGAAVVIAWLIFRAEQSPGHESGSANRLVRARSHITG